MFLFETLDDTHDRTGGALAGRKLLFCTTGVSLFAGVFFDRHVLDLTFQPLLHTRQFSEKIGYIGLCRIDPHLLLEVVLIAVIICRDIVLHVCWMALLGERLSYDRLRHLDWTRRRHRIVFITVIVLLIAQHLLGLGLGLFILLRPDSHRRRVLLLRLLVVMVPLPLVMLINLH